MSSSSSSSLATGHTASNFRTNSTGQSPAFHQLSPASSSSPYASHNERSPLYLPILGANGGVGRRGDVLEAPSNLCRATPRRSLRALPRGLRLLRVLLRGSSRPASTPRPSASRPSEPSLRGACLAQTWKICDSFLLVFERLFACFCKRGNRFRQGVFGLQLFAATLVRSVKQEPSPARLRRA